jgi:flavorubredoxin
MVLGPNHQIHLAYINHQDPDVGMNTVFFQRHFPNLQVIATEDTWRLVRFLGLNPKRFIPIEKFKTGKIKLITGHRMSFIPTPYCHFRGASAIFDEEHRILFSGDLFGGLTDSPDIYADESYWEGIKIFHQIYMPVNLALKNAVENFRNHTNDIKIIAPQHGRMITGDLVNDFLDRMSSLQVGLDLTQRSKMTSDSFISAMNEILQEVKAKVGADIAANTLKTFDSDGSFPEILVTKNDRIISVKIGLEEAFQLFVNQLLSDLDEEKTKKVKFIVMNTLTFWNINAENFSLEESGSALSVTADGDFFDDTESGQSDKPINIEKAMKALFDHSGGEKFARLATLRIMVKIPPQILKRNNIKGYNDLIELKETTDMDLAHHLFKAVEAVIGKSIS